MTTPSQLTRHRIHLLDERTIRLHCRRMEVEVDARLCEHTQAISQDMISIWIPQATTTADCLWTYAEDEAKPAGGLVTTLHHLRLWPGHARDGGDKQPCTEHHG